MADLTPVVSALVDAAFRSGSITDAQHTDLHNQLSGDAEQEAPTETETPPEVPATPPVEASPYV